MTAKPTVEELGIDVGAQAWHRSGGEAGSIEIAFVGAGQAGCRAADGAPGGAEWVLMRVAGDRDQRVLVYSRLEWECFLNGVKNGEFDDAAQLPPSSPNILVAARRFTANCDSQLR